MHVLMLAAEAANTISVAFPAADPTPSIGLTDEIKRALADADSWLMTLLAAGVTWLTIHSGSLFVRILGKKLGDKAQVLFEDRLKRALAYAQAATGKAIADLDEDDLIHAIDFLRSNFASAVGSPDAIRQKKTDNDLLASLKASVAQVAGGKALPQFAAKPAQDNLEPAKPQLSPDQIAALKAIVATLDPQSNPPKP